MNNFKSTALGLVKWIGLIALSLLINVAPMLFLRLGKSLPIYAEILLVALYLILVFLIFRSLWQRYQKRVPEEKKKFKLSGKDIGFAFLFFFLARVAAIVGVYLNLILICCNNCFYRSYHGRINFPRFWYCLLFQK